MFGLFSKRDGANSGDVAHDELVEAMKSQSYALVDVREPQEFEAGHVAGAINLPLSRFDPGQLPKEKPVVLMCRSGGRSGKALAQARAAGRDDVRHYPGGVIGWSGAGGELV